MNRIIEERFGVKCLVPIEGEMSMGNNWLEKEVITTEEHREAA
jgi:hypothetical protein